MSQELGAITLRIKAQSLQDEAKYIRRWERRLRRARSRAKTEQQRDVFTAQFWSIQEHRRKDVRNEARSTHLARMLVKGTQLARVEDPVKTRTKINAERVATLLSSHMGIDIRVARQRVTEWVENPGLPQAA